MFPIRLSKIRFSPGGRRVLSGVDFDVECEGITAIIGPNGAGKTVLLRVLAGLQETDGGTIRWNGASRPESGIAMVFQSPIMLRSSVFFNAGLGLKPAGLTRSAVRQRTQEVLERVALAHRAKDSARLLSGGERQRLALARAWAVRPKLMLLDEPTAALDPSATDAVERIVREIRTEGTRVVMTTHNLGQAMRISDDIVFMDEGRVVERAPASRFFARPQTKEAQLFIQGELPWRIAFDS